MATYTLPALPYDYAALEPHISGRIMELHHDKHHAAYVSGANAALEALAAARESNDFAAINLWEKNLAFNLAGHTNHTLFWKNLAPKAGGEPEGELAEAIKDSFGSFKQFQAQFTAAALGIQGSGWAMLAFDVLSGKLVVLQLFDHQSNLPAGTLPLFLVDMWEHAFYLDYLNVKADYVKAIWNIANWQNVSETLSLAVSKRSEILKTS
ncbi:Superoxide dismutase [Mn] [Actinomyces bovis]|uniref:Superoxide dismutase n=1 Tax=Actinomyces bovis TaxID=1658 RepID=A0ABY1VK19_9ACTO|nr:superoxide dismutase [Actinomyces bovis]SPT52454.1 Superoxide dismutase [Mn] [Actinomyces bovis]VEG54119.1 Superoxide dismutase [Mn] [Actinomyces israelii]